MNYTDFLHRTDDNDDDDRIHVDLPTFCLSLSLFFRYPRRSTERLLMTGLREEQRNIDAWKKK